MTQTFAPGRSRVRVREDRRIAGSDFLLSARMAGCVLDCSAKVVIEGGGA